MKAHTYYAWRHDPAGDGEYLTQPFDPMTEEFNIYEMWFTTPNDAVEFICDFLGEDTVPDEYALVEITERRVPFSTLAKYGP